MLRNAIQFLLLILLAYPAAAQRVGGTTAVAIEHSQRYLEVVPPGTFFYEGFEAAQRPNLPTGWSSQSNANEGFISGTAGDAPGQTNANGFWPVPLHGIFALSNDDVCNCDKSQDRLLSPIINAAEKENVILRFSAFQNGSGSQSALVQIKAAGLPWLEVFEIPARSLWQTHEILIPPSYLESSFQFRFLYSDQGNYASGLAIDDVYLTTNRSPRFSLDEFYSIGQELEGSGQLYHGIPEKQARKARWKFAASVTNTYPSRKNASLALSVDGPIEYVETTPDWLIGEEIESKVDFPKNLQFSPYEIGDYTLSMALTSDSVDQETNDNLLSTTFGVSDSIYQRVAFSNGYSTGVWLQSPGDRYGTGFYLHEPDSVHAILINLHPASSEGARFRVKIFSYDTLSSSFYSSGLQEVQEDEPGSVVRIPVNRKISKGRKLFIVEKEAGSGNVVIAAQGSKPSKGRNTLTKKVSEDWKESPYFPQLAVVTDPVDDGCSGHIQFTQSNESCVGAEDGTIETQVLDENSSLTFNWSSGAGNTAQVDDLAAGLYDLFVTTGEGCIYHERFEILAADSIKINPAVIALDSCNQSNGILNLVISGGFAPYDITWNGKTGLEIEQGLEAGLYLIDITDSKGCNTQLNTELAGTDAIGVTFNISAPSCNDTNGAVSTISFGTPPFKYTWNNGDTISALSGIEAGVYTLTITDSVGCQSIGQALISNDPAATITLADLSDVTCYGSSSGAIDLTIGGGNPPYLFDWSNGGFTEDIQNLEKGRYTLSLTDAIGCKAYFSAEVEDDNTPLLLNFNAKGNYCWRDTNGVLEPIVSGGSAPYSYNWSTGSSASALANLSAGNYSLTITDNVGCTRSKSYHISDGFTFFVRTDSVTADTSDNNIDEGNIFMSTFGGTPPYSHIWNDSVEGEDLISVPNGEYVLTYRDQLGCIEVFVIMLSNGPAAIDYQKVEPKLRIYPNPIKRGHPIRIDSDGPLKSGILLDLQGKVVSRLTGLNASIISTSNWPAGSHILILEDAGGTTTQFKLIVK